MEHQVPGCNAVSQPLVRALGSEPQMGGSLPLFALLKIYIFGPGAMA